MFSEFFIGEGRIGLRYIVFLLPYGQSVLNMQYVSRKLYEATFLQAMLHLADCRYTRAMQGNDFLNLYSRHMADRHFDPQRGRCSQMHAGDEGMNASAGKAFHHVF